MQPLAFYLLKVIICSGVLLLYYRFALRNKRFHYYNRFYLLATVAASILLPLLNINWFTISSNSKAIALMNVIYVQDGSVAVKGQGSRFSINWQQLPLIIYTLITLFFIGLLIWRVSKIYAFKKKYSATSMGGFDFINTDLPQAPFSFLQNLFWRSDIDLNETTGRQILQHEITHIRQKHTWDKLCIQLILATFWINPFYWFIQKELYLLHEFIADEKAIENNDGAAFATMLLTSQYGNKIFAPAQSFAYSPIKRRLYMLTNLAKPKYSYARRLMALPLLATVILLFAFRVQTSNNNNPQQITLVETPAAFKVVIDAGHGGDDDGLVGHGITEKDIALKICKRIETLAPKYNIDVVLTRGDDNNITPEKRIDVVTEQNAGAFVSIHLDNASVNSGFNTYVSRDNKNFAASKLLGSAVMQNLAASHKIDKTLKERKEGSYVLQYSPAPAILVECGAINNTADIKELTNEEKITTIAKEILQGIASFANYKGEPIEINPVPQGGFTPKTDTVKHVYLVSTLNASGDTTRSISKALIILDGKEVSWAKFNTLSPDDIESIFVLKGHTATDKYGAKGSNGVLEINTKAYAVTNLQLKEVRVADKQSLTAITVEGHKLNEPVVTGVTLTEIKADKPGGLTLKKGDMTMHTDSITLKGVDEVVVVGYAKGMQPARFPGGSEAWQKYLARNLNVNLVSDKGGPVGTYVATVSFTVDEEGNLSDFKIVKDPGYGTGQEAVRVLQRGPRWVPAQQDGKPVKTMQRQNVTWTISEG